MTTHPRTEEDFHRLIIASAQLLLGDDDLDALRSSTHTRISFGSTGLPIDLVALADQVRRLQSDVLHIGFDRADSSNFVPNILLAIRHGEQVRVFEQCFLWMIDRYETARIVPDGFKGGYYRFASDGQLRHFETAPAASFEAAKEGMARAYRCLRKAAYADIEGSGVSPLLHPHVATLRRTNIAA